MSLWAWLDGGMSMAPKGERWGERLALWWGRHLAVRHRHVRIARSTRISPQSRINPRQGQIVMGEDCAIAPYAVVQGYVTLGNNCSIQAYSLLIGYGSPDDPDGRIEIGNDVRIAPHVMMIGGNHAFGDTSRPITKQGLEYAPIIVEDDVWVAGRVTITAGVRIGRGSVIGAGAVVTRDIPAWSVAAGVPARVIKSRKPGDAVGAGVAGTAQG